MKITNLHYLKHKFTAITGCDVIHLYTVYLYSIYGVIFDGVCTKQTHI